MDEEVIRLLTQIHSRMEQVDSRLARLEETVVELQNDSDRSGGELQRMKYYIPEAFSALHKVLISERVDTTRFTKHEMLRASIGALEERIGKTMDLRFDHIDSELSKVRARTDKLPFR